MRREAERRETFVLGTDDLALLAESTHWRARLSLSREGSHVVGAGVRDCFRRAKRQRSARFGAKASTRRYATFPDCGSVGSFFGAERVLIRPRT